ncbi:hypothetical protein AAAZ61_15245, partial [Phocaeicola coprocola]
FDCIHCRKATTKPQSVKGAFLRMLTLITNDQKQTFNFLVENDQTLTLLNDKLEKSQSNLNYQLKKVN